MLLKRCFVLAAVRAEHDFDRRRILGPEPGAKAVFVGRPRAACTGLPTRPRRDV